VSREKAAQLLGTMQGGYKIESLVSLLDDAELAPISVKAIADTRRMFEDFYDFEERPKAGKA
jgi:aconitate hydratase 2/2-methylisocitrate dehydratase